ncbi:G protein-coupled receptor kinase 4 [Phytophthora boehmeriae]|uniref:G protein-coupled receptor kinase 4 n=1 Tax=Phytophthora boehmeriae TaxID=109152 RepID=A0A8T1XDZ8_9STRA|nr:G protein-coupled receptor kinase 4 [Phytophthora boehmeriae]
MDELHDAIQDAQYIGAVTNAQRGPSAAFYNPSANEIAQFVDRQERALGSDWLSLENLLDMPLGFYLFRRFCEVEQHGNRKLDFLVDVTKYRTLQTADQRAAKARDIWEQFFGPASPNAGSNSTGKDSGVTIWSPATRVASGRQASPISPVTAASTSPGAEFVSASGKAIAPPPRTVSMRMSLGCIEDLNVASITTNGIVFWRKNESSVTRVDVRNLFNSVSTEASPIGVSGEVVHRLSVILKRKMLPDRDREDSLNCLRDGSPTSVTSSPTSTASTNDVSEENRPDNAKNGNQRGDKRNADTKGYPPTLFDEIEACVLCSLEQFHLKDFRASAFHRRLVAFLFLQKRRVSEDDFTVLRILGRVEVTSTLTGRCGTRGYWAPEMLLRDESGNRMVYNHAVDWWSYGCLVYELLYGKCPFRTSKAKALHDDKQQAYDKATLELTPAYDSKYFSAEAADLIQKLLIRDPTKRLGANGADEIKRMKFFSSIDWVAMEQQQVPPPFVPDSEINAASQADIGSFDISTVKGIKLSEQEQAAYSGWDYVCPETFQREAVEYLVWEIKNGPCTIGANNNSCCTIL